ncbi:alkaline phosphatase family protein [Gordonia sp. SID5947]|uniref:alkaline phosphatase D family protein n=1 Tax=Gordonia sp. SID5947 TaxID=2690315 RepID=UPI0013702D83|nr:alkaline phosphatase D family protein [Gordonia sp. SID5947]MYR05537.1 alkaline phosphatase family protein [Gordonia sp. SID5947]
MGLVLGPILRHVGATTATVWVQTDAQADVEVLGCHASTFEVSGSHYALVVVDGLTPGSTTEYCLHVNGTQEWPPQGSEYPASVIQTRVGDRDDGLRVVFGSCRYPKTGDATLDEKLGWDALDCYARRLIGQPVSELPDVVILLGDQVYADELTPAARRHLAGRRGGSIRTKRPPDEVVSFTEYEGLYRHTWGDPEIRWLMSTVPIAMIFDDHDIRDDWNTSAAWRASMNSVPWWRDRIRAGLASYWVYQHLGNLSPTELDADDDYRQIVASSGDCWPLLADLADRADDDTDGEKGLRFSYRWDLGGSRLIMIDSRNGRILSGGARKMLSDKEFAWLEEQMTDDLDAVDHLILGSSLPWLLPPALSDLQAINEIAADRAGLRGRLAEKIRQATDFEHWPAFMKSFRRLSDLIVGVAARSGAAPATVSVLSGDVHHSYVARADHPGAASVHQLVCSPVHNHVPAYVKPALEHAWSPRVARLTHAWARHVGSPAPSMTWSDVGGPLFGNTIATLVTEGRRARVVFEQPRDDGTLAEMTGVFLTD